MPSRSAIRRLFLQPKSVYSIAAAARLLGITANELRAWIDAGEVETADTTGGITIPWSEIVAFGMDIWSQVAVEQALGADVAEAIPDLLSTDGAVRRPSPVRGRRSPEGRRA